MLAEVATDLWSTLAHQGPFVLGVVAILWAGQREIWMYTKQHNAIVAEQAKTITSLEKVIAEKDRTVEFQQRAYEARLKEKEDECDRVRERLEKSEGYTDQLIERAMGFQSIAAVAIKAVTEKGS